MKNRPSQAALGLSATAAGAALDDGVFVAASGGATGSCLAGCFSLVADGFVIAGVAAFEAASRGRTALAGCMAFTPDADTVAGDVAGVFADVMAADFVAEETLVFAATAAGLTGLDAADDAGISGAAISVIISGG